MTTIVDVPIVMSAIEKKHLREQNLTDAEIEQIEIQIDPVRWCETYLRDPENPELPFKFRPHQKMIIRSSNKKKVLRMGRRAGKTVTLGAECIYKAWTNSNERILICCPYKNQVATLWKDGFDRLLKDNPYIEAGIVRRTANPYLIEFNNGSRILGLTAGSRGGNKGSSIRGQSASRLYLDEVDYMGEEAIHAILAITATHRDTDIVVSSTPTGRREYFYSICIDKKLGYEEFHFPSSVSPEWMSIDEAERRNVPLHNSQEFQYRTIYSEEQYAREYLAEFGEASEGVFKHRHIDPSLVSYDNRYEKIDPRGLKWWCGEPQIAKNKYVLGIDWNAEKNGTQFVIMEYCIEPTPIHYVEIDGTPKTLMAQNQYRLYYRDSVSFTEMSQVESVRKTLELNTKFRIDHIYADKGFGQANIEELKLWGMKNNDREFVRKIKSIDFGSNIVVHDPFTKEDVKKPAKAFMVFNAANILERAQLLLPDSEDEKVKLVGQMREYRIEKISVRTGTPTFSAGNDHILDAFMLSLLGFQMEYSELIKVEHTVHVGYSKNSIFTNRGSNTIVAREPQGDDELNLQKYGVERRQGKIVPERYTSDSRASYKDFDELTPKKTRSPFVPARRTGWSIAGNPTRKSF